MNSRGAVPCEGLQALGFYRTDSSGRVRHAIARLRPGVFSAVVLWPSRKADSPYSGPAQGREAVNFAALIRSRLNEECRRSVSGAI